MLHSVTEFDNKFKFKFNTKYYKQTYIHIYVYVYTHTQRKRERERERDVNIFDTFASFIVFFFSHKYVSQRELFDVRSMSQQAALPILLLLLLPAKWLMRRASTGILWYGLRQLDHSPQQHRASDSDFLTSLAAALHIWHAKPSSKGNTMFIADGSQRTVGFVAHHHHGCGDSALDFCLGKQPPVEHLERGCFRISEIDYQKEASAGAIIVSGETETVGVKIKRAHCNERSIVTGVSAVGWWRW